MKTGLKNWIFVILSVLLSSQASAKLLEEDTMDQYAEQSQGNYQPMNLNYAGFNSLGMVQSAWQDPLQNLGEGQSKPAYSKYYWSPDLVLPIRLREAMMTLVNFPEWELIENIYIGDTNSFDGQISGPNTLLLYPRAGTNVGVDSNIIVFGRSGNKYVFYVKSEGVNTERLTNSIIDIDVVDGAGASGGSPRGGSGVLGGSGNSGHINANNYYGRNGKSVDSTFTKRFLKEDWLKSIPLDPAKFRFDIEIYVPNPDDVVIAPERVWRDDIFTYIDLGEKALNMVQRPIVTLIVERVETPVGFRTKGPNNRLIIVEGIGDMVMRNGKRMVCLKLRRSDDEGTQYVSYADDDNAWDVGPKIPNGANGGNGSSGGAGNMSGVNSGNSANGAGGANVGNGANGGGMNGSMMTAGGVCMATGCGDLDYSKMTRIDRSHGGSMQNPYPQYKYGSAFNSDSAGSLSVELGTDSNVNNLESTWQDLSKRYPSLLGGYEPFYSVDAPADGQGKELFHLRVGPIKNLDSGDSLCSQLGRNGVFCSVIRMQ
ncbi:MAG: TrbG/VirB9 family P-type conjugative transfer protein [Alphaproteobacteria bacterium]|nr:TrbG/VirB9 family P-type conjugative transfer protein [Alphaproteobacteria bacterium]